MIEPIPSDFPPGQDGLTAAEQRRLRRIHLLLDAPPYLLILRSLPMAAMHVGLIGLLLWVNHRFSLAHAELGRPVNGVFVPIPGTLDKLVRCMILFIVALGGYQILGFFMGFVAERSLYQTFYRAYQNAKNRNV